jgi:hypothetical protein
MMPTDALPVAEFLIRHLYWSIDVADGKTKIREETTGFGTTTTQNH